MHTLTRQGVTTHIHIQVWHIHIHGRLRSSECSTYNKNMHTQHTHAYIHIYIHTYFRIWHVPACDIYSFSGSKINSISHTLTLSPWRCWYVVNVCMNIFDTGAHMHLYVCMYVCTSIHTHTYKNHLLSVYINTHIHINMYTYIQDSITSSHTYLISTYIRTHAYIHAGQHHSCWKKKEVKKDMMVMQREPATGPASKATSLQRVEQGNTERKCFDFRKITEKLLRRGSAVN
jgi:hypothetical protein